MSSQAASPLKRLRKERGLSMEALARDAGVSTATVYRAEHQRHRTTDEVWEALAAALDVEVEELHDDDPDTATNGRGKTDEPDTAAVERSAGLAQHGG